MRRNPLISTKGLHLIRRLHPAFWIGLLLLLSLVVRTRMEHSRVLSLSNEVSDLEQKGIHLAEAARWAWPFGSERSEHLNRALEISLSLQKEKPDAARAVAEEVRASIYSVRTGGPAYPEILSRANSIIVSELARRDQLNEEEREELQKKFDAPIGPNPTAKLMSSLGFALWLLGLGVLIWAQGRRRQWGALMSLTGLALYLGFLPLA